MLPSDTFDVHAVLRAATHATHIRLHDLAPFNAIAQRQLDRAGYAGLLRSLLTYHTIIVGAAERGGLLHLSTSPRRQALLESDLASLDAAPSAERPRWSAPSRAALYGALYVAEGSALGGRVIARQLDYLLCTRAEGRLFFRGDSNTGPRWHSFLGALQEGCDEAATPALIAGAEASFALFERCVAA